LEVEVIVIRRAVVDKAIGTAILVVQKQDCIRTGLLAKKSSFEPVILGGYSIDRFRSAETIGVVGIRDGFRTLVYRSKVAGQGRGRGELCPRLAEGLVALRCRTITLFFYICSTK